jgi:hypothetical protein
MAVFTLVRSLNRQYASQAAGFAAVTISAAVLIGWWGGLPSTLGFATVKPVTALCLAALGLALAPPGKNLHFAFAVGLAVLLLALFDLDEDLFGFDFGIDGWLVPRTAVSGTGTASFQMVNGMPLATALAGGSLALNRFVGQQFTATAVSPAAWGCLPRSLT